MTDALDDRRTAIDAAIEGQLESPVETFERAIPTPSRLRGQLFLSVYEALRPNATINGLVPTAVALELSTLHLHVHDGIDDETDDLGGEILRGDYLQARAFEALGRSSAPPQVVTRCHAVLADACVEAYGRSYRGGPRREPLVAAATMLAGVLADVDRPLQRRLTDCGERLEASLSAGLEERTVTGATPAASGTSGGSRSAGGDLPSPLRAAIDDLVACTSDEWDCTTDQRLTTIVSHALDHGRSP